VAALGSTRKRYLLLMAPPAVSLPTLRPALEEGGAKALVRSVLSTLVAPAGVGAG
jgi:hypothetical protein